MQNSKPRSVMPLVFLTVFMDLVGFSVIFPLFPAMLTHYTSLEGSDSLIGRLLVTLQEIVGDRAGAEFAVVTLFGGVLGALYSALQFVFAPIWGHLSDRHGRRPLLLVTLGGTAFSYLLWFFAGSFSTLIFARLVGGIMAGNISLASAVVSDTHEGPQRAKGMGMIGVAIGLGFVIGPAVGGIASLWDLSELWAAGAAYGVNPFSAAALAALVLSSFNWLWAFRRFPETLPEEKRGKRTVERTLRPFHALRSIDYPGVRRTHILSAIYLTAFSGMEFTLTFLAVERFDYTTRDNMWMFIFVGLVIALVQGGAVRRLVPKYGEKKVTIGGLACMTPGFVLVGLSSGTGVFYAGLFLMSVGSALAMPCLSSLVSRYTPGQVQGLVLGTFRSVGALARAVGPLLSGVLYWLLGSAAPYLAGAVFLLLPLGIAFGLPPVPEKGPGTLPEEAPNAG